MNIIINGKEEQMALQEPTLEQLLAAYSLQGKSVIIEANGQIVPKEKIGSTTVKEGDRIEIVQFVGGG
ncbi:sulfur carrier protein ThiS [Pseudobacillus wudalianchiensis]|uniref:Thiamine biosynthesis protein ThiS n=1 Tax=Pseudobacillus wudalianchiensis TaxID=1743143 RepID=A0A1B9B788_9BACI|nr:sulfur carrier protein ThiS [Bacillus wudalianchiensis]OCA91964.1 thiamine biosynthesis protein ThiS [Bacillus wudalianchiensis]